MQHSSIIWPYILHFLCLTQLAAAMDHICIDFGIDNSSHFHFRAHTNIVADSTDHRIHTFTTDSLANHQLVSNTCQNQHKLTYHTKISRSNVKFPGVFQVSGNMQKKALNASAIPVSTDIPPISPCNHVLCSSNLKKTNYVIHKLS